ncbi:MAG: protein adenylyltransferase SelO [Planctomycetota bacterium]
MTIQNLDELVFDNQFVRQLPCDPEPRNFRRQVRNACYSRVLPTPVCAPKLLACSREVADLLDLHPSVPGMSDFAAVFGGNQLAEGMDPFAMCYGGHQFGNWAGQLGDGRAINLGEVVNHRRERWMLQLKGAGPTPYSRTADGLAVLRSSVREFLCSEAMAHLGVPTTRALSLVETGERVTRDMFYDGNPKQEPGAIVCRVAPSFTRFGNFEILAARRETELLERLLNHTMTVDFGLASPADPKTREAWFTEVCHRTADMVVHWMRVGFVHGVMNTDNMSILGLTIDYGPYGWLEDYDPGWTPNTTDAGGRRYRYGAQPQIAMWNLVQLANALVPAFDSVEPLQTGITAYSDRFNEQCLEMLLSKLGLVQGDRDADKQFTDDLLTILQMVETDMTIFYRRLADLPLVKTELQNEAPLRQRNPSVPAEHPWLSLLSDAWYRAEELTSDYLQTLLSWLDRYRRRCQDEGLSDTVRRERMNLVNPKYVLRNYLAQLAIDKAEAGDASMIMELLDVLRNPYDDQPEQESLAARRPEWARTKAGCSMLSCSS